jgi:hypothetical protein
VLRRAAGVVALLLTTAGIAACGDDGERAAGTTTTVRPTTTSSTTTTEPEDPWAVPENIDEAYVQRVLTELYRLDGEARRIAVREDVVTEDVIERAQQIYIPEEAAERLNRLMELGVRGFEGLLRPPGSVKVEVSGLERRRPDCVVVRVLQDFTAVSADGLKDVVSFVELFRGPGNDTGWLLGSNSVGPDGQSPEEFECA